MTIRYDGVSSPCSIAIETGVEAVLADLLHPDLRSEGVDVEIVHVDGNDWEVCLSIEDSSRITRVECDAAAADWRWIAFLVADDFQDELSEASRSPRPRCPLHGHPLSLDAVDRVPIWRCNRAEWSCEVGLYSTSI